MARDEIAEIEAVLSDPIAVHVNMMRGVIAKPSIENIIHLYGRDALRASLRSQGREDGARTPEPSPGLLMSMAIRYDHALGMPGRRDWKVCPGIGEKEAGLHARILANTMSTMHQLWEEVSGQGFYSPAREAEYVAWAERCGVSFGEDGRPKPLLLRPAQEADDA